jgi:hypothetical protein
MNIDQTLCFDWFFKRTGVEDEIEMLQLEVRDADEHVPAVIECYRRWLIDHEPKQGIEAALVSYRDGVRMIETI